MTAALLLQYLIIFLIAVFSAWVMMKKLLPGTVRYWRTVLALRLLRPGRGPALQALGRKLAPPVVTSIGACGSCTQCGPGKRGKAH